MCEQEKSPENSCGKTENYPPKKSHGFLSSVFSTHGSFSRPKRSLFHSDEKSPKSEEKSQSFFSSVINSNQTLFSDLSSKIEAAFNLSLDVSDSDASSNSERTSRKNSVTDKQSDSSSQPEIRRLSLPITKTDHVGRHHRYTKRKGMKHKDRSVYGQPEISSVAPDVKPKSWKDHSQESLDTVDSGQSLGNCSTLSTNTEFKLDKTDPFYVYRRPESMGIGSESDPCGQSTSLESSDAESIPEGHCHAFLRCGSGSSLYSWTSSPSCDSQPDDITLECMDFMKVFIKKIFSDCSLITLEEKSKFGELCQQEVGRLWFARWVNSQRVHCKEVTESTFFSLVQHFAIVLFECFEVDDFSPAKSIMNMCFTFYFENPAGRLTVYIPCLAAREGRCPAREYLFYYLKDQPIWQSVRFWNAAFFDAVQGERANRHIPTREDLAHYSPEDYSDEKSFQENIVFGQLGTFTYNMYAFGLSKEFCLEFLRKQCIIASLSKEHISLLKESIDRMYSGDIGKEYR